MWEHITTSHSIFDAPSGAYLDAIEALDEYGQSLNPKRYHGLRRSLFDPIFQECGVYGIACEPTGQVYIGMTTRTFFIRWNQHWTHLEKGVHYVKKLQRIWTLYGSDQFTFCVLAVKPKNELDEWLRRKERRWIQIVEKKGGLLNQGLTGRKLASY